MMARSARCGASEAEGLRRIREIERRRLSRALHDEAGPLLCSAGLAAELLYSAIPAPSPQQEELFTKLRSTLESVVGGIRLLSQEAAPDLAERHGLQGALATLAQAHGAELRMDALPQLPPGRAHALCELVRDALLACGPGPGRPRIHTTHQGVRIESASAAGDAVAGALRQAARAAGFGFSSRGSPAARFEFLVEGNS